MSGLSYGFGFGFPRTLLRVGGGAAPAPFTPADLFASGEVGAWYDPSDLSTMWATNHLNADIALETAIGVILDKSQGLAADDTKVIDPATDVTTWTNTGNTGDAFEEFSFDGPSITVLNTAQATGIASAYTNTLAPIDIVAGEIYYAEFVVTNYSGSGGGAVDLSLTTNTRSTAALVSANGTYRVYLRATLTQANASFRLYSSDVGFGCTLTLVALYKVKGNHAYQVTVASRPVLRARYNWMRDSEEFTAATTQWGTGGTNPVTADSVVAPDGTTTADLITFAAGGRIYQNLLDVPLSGTYTASCYFKKNDSNDYAVLSLSAGTSFTDAAGSVFNLNTGVVHSDNSAGTGFTHVASSIEDVGSGWYRCSITVTTIAPTNLYLVLNARGDGSWATAQAGNDLVAWGAQLEYGTVLGPYQRITDPPDYDTTSSMETYDFPYYLDFDGVDDYLDTASIDWSATDEITASIGLRSDSTSTLVPLGTAANSTDTQTWNFFHNVTPSSFLFRSRGTLAGDAASSATYPSITTNLLTGLGKISTDSSTLRVDGSVDGTSADDQGTGNFNSARPLYVGRRQTTYWDGAIVQVVVRDTLTDGADLTDLEVYVATALGWEVPVIDGVPTFGV